MLLSVNTVVHLPVNVEWNGGGINSLLEWVFTNREGLLQVVVQELVDRVQESYLAACEAGAIEWVCRSCGVAGGMGVLRRGVRKRRLKTSSGELELSLKQVTCRDCRKTRVAAEELLGLEQRQRVTAELEQRLFVPVFATSYERSAELARTSMGVSVSPSTLHRRVQRAAQRLELTPHPEAEVVIADGTKVRAGRRTEFEDLRLAYQVIDRDEQGGRPRVKKRLLGLAVGTRTWPEVLGQAPATKVVVTDAEPALRAHVRGAYPAARHQLCEWHVTHTLSWSLRTDGVDRKERKAVISELKRHIWGEGPVSERRVALEKAIEQLQHCRTSYKQLTQALDYILYQTPSPERTTSLAERQMREVDRRAWIGARWSETGLTNLLLLSLARTHNPDDYERIWN
jgi:hypothetical protein